MRRVLTGPRVTVCLVALLTLAAAPAVADSGDLLTVGLGGQFSYVTPGVAARETTAEHQYGFITRLKMLRFLGVEAVGQLDEDPNTQDQRILSPRFQLGLMLNLVPTDVFNFFVVAGTGAHNPADLFDLDGPTTSFQGGPGFEVFVGEHMALGADVRFRMPGPRFVKEEVLRTLSSAPVDKNVNLEVWQTNFSFSYYL